MAKSRGKAAAIPAHVVQKSQLPAAKNEGKRKQKDSTKLSTIVPPSSPTAEPDDDFEEEETPSDDAVVEGSNEDTVESEEDDDTDPEEDSGDEGIDQEGMERLMELLGEDGLDDFDRAQLTGLGDEEGEDSEDEEEGEEVSIEGGEGESNSGAEDKDKGMANGEKDEIQDNADTDGDEEDDEAVPLDEVESIDGDALPQQKLEIDNKVALERIRQTIQLDSSLPWTETLTLTYPEKIEVDVSDDLNRELAFYKQALHSAQSARTLAAKHNFPFTRPSDYFAEMVKSDVHMERIRQRLLNEGATIKKSEEKRKEREGKKFGKQVQLEKLKEREKSKKEMEERLKNLKRKRKDLLDNPQGNDDEDFDVAVEEAISDRPSKRSKSSGGDVKAKNSRMPRHARDKKFGFGGAGRRSKQNTKESTDNFGPGAGRGKKGKGGAGGNGTKHKRPGKSRRMAARSKP